MGPRQRLESSAARAQILYYINYITRPTHHHPPPATSHHYPPIRRPTRRRRSMRRCRPSRRRRPMRHPTRRLTRNPRPRIRRVQPKPSRKELPSSAERSCEQRRATEAAAEAAAGTAPGTAVEAQPAHPRLHALVEGLLGTPDCRLDGALLRTLCTQRRSQRSISDAGKRPHGHARHDHARHACARGHARHGHARARTHLLFSC